MARSSRFASLAACTVAACMLGLSSPVEPTYARAAPAAPPTAQGEPGELQWGPYTPRPRWKWATFGVSAALLGAGLVASMVTIIPVARSHDRRGFLWDNAEAAARASLEDASTINDVDPSIPDICSDFPGSGGARELLDADDGVATPGVRNVAVTRECERGETWARAATGAVIFSSVMAVSTIVFTTLLFVRRVPDETRVSFGIAPDLQGGGAHMVGRVRF